jgi:hypothetical protein
LNEIEDVSVKVDSCWFTLEFGIDNNISDSLLTVNRLDVLVYDADGIGSLESWKTCYGIPGSLMVKGARRAKSVVAIANSPRSLNRRAIERYDSIELLSYEFNEDSPDAPLMSGTCSMSPDVPAHISLSPLMSRVQLCGISNLMTKWVRLENPRIFLRNVNPAAEIMRVSGFRPTEVEDLPSSQPLPFDIGAFEQHPMTGVYCYPNDSPDATIGTPRTSLVLECEIKGETCRFPVELESIPRNSTVHVDISVSGPETYESKVY